MRPLETCCCFTLPTAALIIGWFGVVCGSGNLITGLYGSSKIDNYITRYTPDAQISIDDQRLAYKIVFALLIVISVIRVTTSACLIAGTIQRRRYLLIPHLCIEAVALLLLGIYMFWYLVLCVASFNSTIFATFIGLLVTLALSIYLYIVVYSLFKMLKNEACNRDHLDVQNKKNINGLPAYGVLC